MYEIRLHGRGGQGAVMASGILATGLVAAGKFAVHWRAAHEAGRPCR